MTEFFLSLCFSMLGVILWSWYKSQSESVRREIAFVAFLLGTTILMGASALLFFKLSGGG